MLNENKICNAQNIINSIGKADGVNVKRIISDNSLIEKVDNEKIYLTEDNRQLLFS
jgi:hypothetical protein